MKLVARGVTFEWPRRPLVMGIVNLGADSFSGDGLTDLEQALEHARSLVRDGAEIIDVGAESARTNRPAIGEEEEAETLIRFIERWKELAPLSINTWRPTVARAALAAGGHLLNDIGGLPTEENARICAAAGAALVIMHSVGAPKVAHTSVAYADVMAELGKFFAGKIGIAEAAGLSRDALLLDPGVDFAKQRADNLRIYRELKSLTVFGRPILLPVSRKTVIGEVLNLPEPAERDAGTVACIVEGMLQGAAIFRVHNVRAAVQTVRMIEAIQAAEA
ncbi:MAG TPA: dihydropteroate synthase [Chthoniobacteraceae bacterium]|jgi:dihydropteroate synthase